MWRKTLKGDVESGCVKGYEEVGSVDVLLPIPTFSFLSFSFFASCIFLSFAPSSLHYISSFSNHSSFLRIVSLSLSPLSCLISGRDNTVSPLPEFSHLLS